MNEDTHTFPPLITPEGYKRLAKEADDRALALLSQLRATLEIAAYYRDRSDERSASDETK